MILKELTLNEKCKIKIEKHEKNGKYGNTIFYKLFINEEWHADIGSEEILFHTLMLKCECSETEAIDSLKGFIE